MTEDRYDLDDEEIADTEKMLSDPVDALDKILGEKTGHGDTFMLPYDETKAKLSALLVEARIDELNELLEHKAEYGYYEATIDAVDVEVIDDRIAVLTHKPQGDSRE